ncbi:fluoroquinolone export ABC transporter permease subunit [Paenibacillus sonchi]|uniref:fluoroquinolone export ABC transporter permease subunit n=1 Tax=Paenibacillus sonchi TaxID=373687 RepID=UPI001E2D34AF|nr:ABC transporter permease [Paenibacillus sonchi]MCE3200907.1 ABC transporter permease [Paenibacillus sonchi]
MRFASALGYDIRLQFRHGFYYVYLVICLIYTVLLSLLPVSYRETADILLTFSDPGMLGFFFIGGLVLLEKGQGIHDNLFVTPYTIAEYICSKTLSLTLLSLAASYSVHAGTFGFRHNPVFFLAGVGLTSVFFTLAGLGVAVRCKTLNGFFLYASAVTAIFLLPFVDTVGLWTSPLLMILPAAAALALIGSVFHPLGFWQNVYMLSLLTLWCGVAYLWTLHSLQHFIVFKTGGGS